MMMLTEDEIIVATKNPGLDGTRPAPERFPSVSDPVGDVSNRHGVSN